MINPDKAISTKYLRITIHDNDFTTSLEHVANTLGKIF